MPRHLITPKDVKEVREILLEEQEFNCKVTGLELSSKDAVCDHDHDTQFVRGILHRQLNSFVGKLENNYKRMLGWWYPASLPTVLRQVALYLEDTSVHHPDILHPGWIKRCKTDFNKLNSKGQEQVLKAFFVQGSSKNAAERKSKFEKLLKSKAVTFDEVKEEIEFARMLTASKSKRSTNAI